jgi:uncharacterized protein YyaL (SSP411 family)
VLRFIEKNHTTENGLFAMGFQSVGDQGKWFWFYEDVKEILSPEELPVWIAASGMKEGGNMPASANLARKDFKANRIAFVKSPKEVADLLGIAPSRVNELLESARAKLLKVRNDRLEPGIVDKEPHAAVTFKMVSAYAAAYRITGEVSYRDLASETLVKAKEYFSEGSRLKIYSGDLPESISAARASVYGLAIQAGLDVEAVTLNREWLEWISDLCRTVAEGFSTEAYIKECPDAAHLLGTPIADRLMIFEESTLGLFSMLASRLDALGVPLEPGFREKLIGFPLSAINFPIVYADSIQAALMRHYSLTYVFDQNASDEWKEALARSPLDCTNRRLPLPSDPTDRIPAAGEVIRISPDGGVSPVPSASDIRLPSVR